MKDYKSQIVAKLDKIKSNKSSTENKICSSCGSDILVTFELGQDVTRSFCPNCRSNNNYKRNEPEG